MNQKTPFKDYIFVSVQLLLFVVYFLPIQIYDIQLPGWLRYSGLVLLCISLILGGIALLQLNTKLSPFPTPVASGKLITRGAYRISRHPIYTALIFTGVGYAIYTASVYKMLVTCILWILFYYKSLYEENLMTEKFPEYDAYKKETRRFI